MAMLDVGYIDGAVFATQDDSRLDIFLTLQCPSPWVSVVG